MFIQMGCVALCSFVSIFGAEAQAQGLSVKPEGMHGNNIDTGIGRSEDNWEVSAGTIRNESPSDLRRDTYCPITRALLYYRGNIYVRD